MPQGPSLPRAFCQRCGMYVPLKRTYTRGLKRLILNLTILGLFASRGARWHCTNCGSRIATPGRLMTQGEKDLRRAQKAYGKAIKSDIRKLFK